MWGLTRSPSTMHLWGREELASALIEAIKSNTQVQIYVNFQDQLQSEQKLKDVDVVNKSSVCVDQQPQELNDKSINEPTVQQQKLEQTPKNTSSKRKKKKKKQKKVVAQEQETADDEREEKGEKEKDEQQQRQILPASDIDQAATEVHDSVGNTVRVESLKAAMSTLLQKNLAITFPNEKLRKERTEDDVSSLPLVPKRVVENEATLVNDDLVVRTEAGLLSSSLLLSNMVDMVESSQQFHVVLFATGFVFFLLILCFGLKQKRKTKVTVDSSSISSKNKQRQIITPNVHGKNISKNGDEFEEEKTEDNNICHDPQMANTPKKPVLPIVNDSTDTPQSVMDFPSSLEEVETATTTTKSSTSPLTPPRLPLVPPPSPAKRRNTNQQLQQQNLNDGTSNRRTSENQTHQLFQQIIHTQSLLSQPSKRNHYYNTWIEREEQQSSIETAFPKRENIIKWILPEDELIDSDNDDDERENPVTESDDDENQDEGDDSRVQSTVKVEHDASIKIQALVRSFVAQENFLKFRRSSSASKMIQKCWRMVSAKVLLSHQRRAAIQIQAKSRQIVQMKRYKDILLAIAKKQEAAIQIQSIVRSYQIQSQCTRTKRFIMVLQCFVRSCIAKEKLAKLRMDSRNLAAATNIQSFWRMIFQKVLLQDQRNGAIKIQSCVRRLVQRKRYHEMLLVIQSEKDKVTRNAAVTKIQSIVRSHQLQAPYLKTKNLIVSLQCFVRSYLAKERSSIASKKIQTYWRMVSAKVLLSHQRRAAIQIQAKGRQIVQMKRYKDILLAITKKQEAAIQIQSIVRSYQIQSQCTRTKRFITVLQCFVRSCIAKQKLAKLRMDSRNLAAATNIQSFWRMIFQKVLLQDQRNGAIKIQSCVRRLVQRKRYHEMLLVIQSEKDKVTRNAAVTKIQSIVRSHQLQAPYLKTKNLIVSLQCFVRSYLAREKFAKMQADHSRSTTIIQSFCRMILMKVQLTRQRKASVKIQSSIRKMLQMRKYSKVLLIMKCEEEKARCNAAAIQIQSFVRSCKMQCNFLMARYSAIRFQCLVRCFLAKLKLEVLQKEIFVTAAVVKIQSSVRRMIQMEKYAQLVSTQSKNVADKEQSDDIDKDTEQTDGVSETSSEEPTLSQSSVKQKTPPPEKPRMDARVSMLTAKALNAFSKNDHKGAILKWTIALKFHREGNCAENESHLSTIDQTQAWILYKRSVSLMMLGANEAAIMGCEDALEVTPEHPVVTEEDECGQFLHARIHYSMGQALIRLGAIGEAHEEFDFAIDKKRTVLENLSSNSDLANQTEKNANDVTADIELAKEVIKQYEQTVELIHQCEDDYSVGNNSTFKRFRLDALSHINTALKVAPSDMSLHEKKLNLLVSFKCWRQVAEHCEKFAAECSKLVGAFAEDLEEIYPFPCISQCKHLTPKYFEKTRHGTHTKNTTPGLSPEAVEEAVLLLAASLQPIYLRSLRLEERFAQAEAGIDSLKGNGVLSAWLLMEDDKLKRTSTAKRKGDGFFYGGYYEKAVARYATCLKIDSNQEDDDNKVAFSELQANNEGGKLNATLYCNRAASLLKLSKYHEAIMEFNAALRIYPEYMKAMQLKAQCYVKMEQFDHAIIIYENWLQLVKNTAPSPPDDDVESTCIFDGPRDVSDVQMRNVETELAKAKELKDDILREQYECSNSSSDTPAGSHDDDPYGFGATAKARRKQYATASSASRRSNKKTYSMYDQEQPKEKQSETKQKTNPPPRQPRRSNRRYGDDDNDDFDFDSWNSPHNFDTDQQEEEQETHYSILQISLRATNTDIKKAYRTMARQYHPDKNPDPQAADHFRKVQIAYEVLIDETSRRKYNREIW